MLYMIKIATVVTYVKNRNKWLAKELNIVQHVISQYVRNAFHTKQTYGLNNRVDMHINNEYILNNIQISNLH